ncbi:MarR family winged helix-turn-helix transcriptional regulator [Chromobacterium sp. Beijing]|uniref:MarR family winged helix-turn-helix transcriptional regulator n=1 Tax=Chromobacterium sp. Beijing TaxID=2735795 RepID=UPI001F3BFA91|nr:MarR family transcriptional regulator [Chromobacterium sp. Beijing]UJB31382.1 MarR family transcriptional regulator [Chromobacterium sp. Beijing]
MPNSSIPVEAVSRLRLQLMALTRRLRQEAQDDELPFAQLSLLASIERADGAATPSALARAEKLRSSNLASLLRELDAGGLILRAGDPEDGRKVRIRLSGAGRQVLDAHRLRKDDWLRAALAGLPPQRLELLLAAGELLAELAAAETPAVRRS